MSTFRSAAAAVGILGVLGLGGCGGASADDADSAASDITQRSPTLEQALFKSYNNQTEEALTQMLVDELGHPRGAVAVVGKNTVRLWHTDDTDPRKTDFAPFLTAGSVSAIQKQMIAAVRASATNDIESIAHLPYTFLGCGSSWVLGQLGRPDLEPGPAAAKECGFLVDNVPEGRLRQFEFVIGKSNQQFIYVTTNVLQRAAVFVVNQPLRERVLLWARPDSWGDTLELAAVTTKSELDEHVTSDHDQAAEMKRALRLFGTPTSLSDASIRWYDKQRNIEAKKPVFGATLAAIGAAFGITEALAGWGLFTAGTSGAATITAAEGATVWAGASAQAANSVAMAAGVWKMIAGSVLVLSSAAKFGQLQRIIQLEENPQRRANAQIAYAWFMNSASAVGMIDMIAANPIVLRAISEVYAKIQMARLVGGEYSEMQNAAKLLSAESLEGVGGAVKEDAFGLFKRILGRPEAELKTGAAVQNMMVANGNSMKMVTSVSFYLDLWNKLSAESASEIAKLVTYDSRALHGVELMNVLHTKLDAIAAKHAIKAVNSSVAAQ